MPRASIGLWTWLLFSCGELVVTPPRVPRGDTACTVEALGFSGSAIRFDNVELPTGCRLVEDDDPLVRSRRTVTVLASDAELYTACRLTPGRSGFDLATQDLYSVRIPHSTHFAWIAERGRGATVVEHRTPCEVGAAQPLRYNVLIAKTSSVGFRLCTTNVSCAGEE